MRVLVSYAFGLGRMARDLSKACLNTAHGRLGFSFWWRSAFTDELLEKGNQAMSRFSPAFYAALEGINPPANDNHPNK